MIACHQFVIDRTLKPHHHPGLILVLLAVAGLFTISAGLLLAMLYFGIHSAIEVISDTRQDYLNNQACASVRERETRFARVTVFICVTLS